MKHLYCIGIVINEYKILLMHRINNILADIEFNCYLIFDRIKNKVVSTSRLSVTMGFWGHGGEKEGYAFTLTIPETPADNMIYRFNLDTFDPASCVENYD